jgi:iron complex transport system substrate-binding protein
VDRARPKPRVIGTLFTLALLLAACGGAAPTATPAAPTAIPAPATATAAPATPAPTPEPTVAPTEAPVAIELVDGLGRTVTLDGPAQRIVSLAPSNTEILFAIGAGGQLVGRDEVSDYPVEAAAVTSIGSLYGAINTEAIVALEPDLILAAEINTPEHVAALEALGLDVYWLANPDDFAGLWTNLGIVGTLTGRTAEAAALANSLKARYDAILAAVAGTSERPTVFYELDATDPTRPFTVGPGSFMDTMIGLAGGANVGGSLSTEFAQVSAEELVAADPDLILLGDAAYGVTVESVGQRAGWGALSAVKAGAVHPFDDNLISRPGPRLVDGLEALARLLHPGAF